MRTEFAVKGDGLIICTINTKHHFALGDFVDDRSRDILFAVTDIFYVLSHGKIEKRVVEIEVATWKQ